MEEETKEKTTWWYVLYVKSNTEHRVIKEMNQYIETLLLYYKVEPFVLESEQYYRNKKYQRLGNKYQKRPLFPGYVFIETDMPDTEFIQVFYDYIYKSSSIIKLLPSNNKNRLAISDEEKTRLEYWSLGRRCIDHSEGYTEGDEVIITSGPLVGQEALITHINRHNRCAEIEMNFLGRKQKIKIALEIIKRKE